MTITQAPQRLRKGMTFRAPIADGHPEFELVESRAGGWLCRGTEDPYKLPDGTTIRSDAAGEQRVFSREVILAALASDAAIRASIAASGKWWATRALGSTLHYHDSFGQYVRGIVAQGDDGTIGIRPTALVGNWGATRLPRRLRDGSIIGDFWVTRIAAGEVWAPHESNVFEAPGFYRRATEQDPRGLAPIDLALPEPSDEERADIAREQALHRIHEVAQGPAAATERIAAIRAILAQLD